jgi:hypothetical protein
MEFKDSAHSIFERWSMKQNNLANIVDVSCDFSWGLTRLPLLAILGQAMPAGGGWA